MKGQIALAMLGILVIGAVSKPQESSNLILQVLKPFDPVLNAAQASSALPGIVGKELSENDLKALFENGAFGALAIGHAEGTIHYDGNENPAINGHKDPANFVPNTGWCSFQNGGTKSRGDRLCTERQQNRLRVWIQDLQAVGINPFDSRNLFIFMAVADLYNQASPIHSRRLPQEIVRYRQKYPNDIVKAVAAARAASFLIDGSNKASGLRAICDRYNYGSGARADILIQPYPYGDCNWRDQFRRTEAMAKVFRVHNMPLE